MDPLASGWRRFLGHRGIFPQSATPCVVYRSGPLDRATPAMINAPPKGNGGGAQFKASECCFFRSSIKLASLALSA